MVPGQTFSPDVGASGSQDVFLDGELLSVDHQQRIVETLLLPEDAKDPEQLLGVLGVRDLRAGITLREGHVCASL